MEDTRPEYDVSLSYYYKQPMSGADYEETTTTVRASNIMSAIQEAIAHIELVEETSIEVVSVRAIIISES